MCRICIDIVDFDWQQYLCKSISSTRERESRFTTTKRTNHVLPSPPPPSIYMYVYKLLGMCRFWDPHSALNFRSEHIIFTNNRKIRSGASPFVSFCRFGDHHFQNFFTFKPFRRRPRPVFCGQPRGYSRPECSRTRPTSQLRRPPISRSSPLRSPTFFTLPWHILTKMWAECPPPPVPNLLSQIWQGLHEITYQQILHADSPPSSHSSPCWWRLIPKFGQEVFFLTCTTLYIMHGFLWILAYIYIVHHMGFQASSHRA